MKLRNADPGGAGTGRGLRIVAALVVTLLAGVCAAAPPPQAGASGREFAALKRQMDQFDQRLRDALLKMFEARPFVILEEPKSTYLEGFGVVVHAELNLYPVAMLSPFTSKQALDNEIKLEQEQKPLRLKELRNRLRELLVEQGTALTLLSTEENVAIVIHLFNVRPQANIPGQVVVQAKRQALLELKTRGGAPEPAALARAVSLREF
jgi:hypothetical protein